MKESVRIIRMNIASRALRDLSRLREDATAELTDLFYVTGDNPSAAELAEGDTKGSRKWQREFMRRLAEDGVVSAPERDHWVVGDQLRLLAILSNAAEDGAMLSRYLFATESEFRAGKALSEQDGYTAENAEEDSDQEDPKVHGQRVTEIGDWGKELSLIAGLQRTLVEAVGKNHIAFDKTLTAISDGLVLVGEELQKLHEGVQKREGSLGKRIEQTEERLVGMQRVLEAMQGTLKGIAGNLGALDAAAQNQARSEQILEQFVKTSAATNARIDALVAVVTADRKNQLGQLLRKLDEHVREGRTLHDMLLEMDTDIELAIRQEGGGAHGDAR